MVEGSFLSCLMDNRYGCSQGGLGLFWSPFIDSGPDTLNYGFHLRSA